MYSCNTLYRDFVRMKEHVLLSIEPRKWYIFEISVRKETWCGQKFRRGVSLIEIKIMSKIIFEIDLIKTTVGFCSEKIEITWDTTCAYDTFRRFSKSNCTSFLELRVTQTWNLCVYRLVTLNLSELRMATSLIMWMGFVWSTLSPKAKNCFVTVLRRTLFDFTIS